VVVRYDQTFWWVSGVFNPAYAPWFGVKGRIHDIQAQQKGVLGTVDFLDGFIYVVLVLNMSHMNCSLKIS